MEVESQSGTPSWQVPSIGMAEAAWMLKVNVKTIRRWIQGGKLKVVLVGARYRTTKQWILDAVKPVVTSQGVAFDEEQSQDVEESYQRLLIKYGIRRPSKAATNDVIET